MPTVDQPQVYLGEVRSNLRSFVAACLGVGSGWLLTMYLTGIFVPHLLKAFGWSKAQFSIVGTIPLLSLIAAPVAGRLTDIFGLRPIAAVGVVASPFIYIAFSAMTGDFAQYFLIGVVQLILVGVTTSSSIYGRLIAERFERARGIALAAAGCTPAVAGAFFAPLLSGFVDSHGWRAGYLAVAAGTAVGGLAALFLIPRREASGQAAERPKGSTLQDYRTVAKTRAFPIIVVGALLCNLAFIVQTSQLTVLLIDRGITATTASWLVSLFAVSAIAGRISSGLALDRFPTHLVAAFFLGAPAIGLVFLAAGVTHPALIAVSIILLGLSLGSEMDIMPYLAMRYFGIAFYGTVVGVITAALATSVAAGSLLLSLTLKLTGSFDIFLGLCAVTTFAGSALILRLGHAPAREACQEPAVQGA